MPHVTVTLLDRKTETPVTSGVFLSVQQDKWGEGFKEQFRAEPDKDGRVEWEATSVTKYRVVADGTSYHSQELLIDSGWDSLTPISKYMYLEQKLIPTPPLNLNHYTRDVSLGQVVPLIILFVALAIILVILSKYLRRPRLPGKEAQ